MPASLSERDQLGIHRCLILQDLLRRFHGLRGNGKEKEALFRVVALLHAARAGGWDPTTISGNEFTRLVHDQGVWERDCLRPAWTRLETAAWSATSEKKIKELVEAAPQYEPAWTEACLQDKTGWTDFEGNRREALHGVRMVENRGLLPRHRRDLKADLAGMPMDDYELARFLKFLTSKNPGQRLFKVTEAGQFRLAAAYVRDALESAAEEKVEPVREGDGRRDEDGWLCRVEGLPAEFDATDHRESNPAMVLENVDLLAAVRTWLEYRAAREEAGSPDWIAATRYLDVASGTVTVRGLARLHEIDQSTLQRAFRRIKDGLQASYPRREPDET